MTVQADLCRTWSETTLLVFPRGGSNAVGTVMVAISWSKFYDSPSLPTCVTLGSRPWTCFSVIFFLVRIHRSLYLMNMWIDLVVDTIPVV